MVDRVENWRRFSKHMEEYIGGWTVEKYAVQGSQGCDLMSLAQDHRICIWNILKYAMRLWNRHEKDREFEKIAHYAEMAWTILEGEKAVVEDEEECSSLSGNGCTEGRV